MEDLPHIANQSIDVQCLPLKLLHETFEIMDCSGHKIIYLLRVYLLC